MAPEPGAIVGSVVQQPWPRRRFNSESADTTKVQYLQAEVRQVAVADGGVCDRHQGAVERGNEAREEAGGRNEADRSGVSHGGGLSGLGVESEAATASSIPDRLFLCIPDATHNA